MKHLPFPPSVQRRYLPTALAALLTFGLTLAIHGQQGNKNATEGSNTKSDPIKPFIGRFVGETVKLISRRSGDEILGELIDGDQTFDFAAKVSDGKLIGKLKFDGLESQFSAVNKGEYLTVLMGTRVIKLKRFTDSPLYHKVRITHSVIAKSPDIVDHSIVVSDDNQYVAFIGHANGKQRVFVNDKAGPSFFRIGRIFLSSTGGQVAYMIQEASESQRVAFKHKVGPVFEEIVIESITISRDGNRIAYIAKRGDKYFVTIDGKQSPPYQSADSISFSDDGSRVGYVAKSSGRSFAVIDGQKGTDCDAVSRVVFSPNGKRYMYDTHQGTKQRLVIDGQLGPPFESIPWFEFTPNSQNVVHTIIQNFQTRVVYNKGVGQLYNSTTYFSFSPDSKRFAYAASRDGRYLIVVDGKEIGPFDDVGQPFFSPDSQSIAHQGIEGKKVSVYVNGKKSGQHCEDVFDMKFSPDSKRHAYMGKRGPNAFVVADGKQMGLFDRVQGGRLWFSPDSEHVVFGGVRGDKHYVVVGSDASELPGRFVSGSRLVFGSPSQFRTITRQGDRFNQVEVKILR